MVAFKRSHFATSSTNPLRAATLPCLAVSTNKTIVTGHERGRTGLIAFHALSEEIGLTRSHRIAADGSECADACPYASVPHQSEGAASQGDAPDHCHRLLHQGEPSPMRPIELGCVR